MANLTEGDWGHACDSYGKVQHSKKACIYTTLKRGMGGDQIVKVAAQIPSWTDARVMAAAKELYAALKWMNHVTEGGYCICPLNDGARPDDDHATCCKDARLALRKAESDHADWRSDLSKPGSVVHYA